MLICIEFIHGMESYIKSNHNIVKMHDPRVLLPIETKLDGSRNVGWKDYLRCQVLEEWGFSIVVEGELMETRVEIQCYS